MAGDQQRTGEEEQLQKELRDEDSRLGRRIPDQHDGETRNQQRRSRFIDLHADEDGDPNTAEHNNQNRGDGNSET